MINFGYRWVYISGVSRFNAVLHSSGNRCDAEMWDLKCMAHVGEARRNSKDSSAGSFASAGFVKLVIKALEFKRHTF